MYGSQTGNAEGIAKDVSDEAKTSGFKPQLLTLDESKSVNFKEIDKALIIGKIYELLLLFF